MNSITDSLNVRIIIQPQNSIRFRYKSEISASHGVLNGINSISNDSTFPTISLEGPEGTDENEFFVMSVLFDGEKHNNGAENILSANFLNKLGTTMISYVPPIEKITKVNDGIYKYSLKNYYIIIEVKAKVKETSMNIFNEIKNLITNYSRLGIETAKQQSKTVRLGFLILTKNKDKYSLCCEPIVSDPIFYDNGITIQKICSTKCTKDDNVTILVNNVGVNKVQVVISDANTNLQYVITEGLEIHKNAAISFNVPEFTSATQKLSIKVHKPKTNDDSNSVNIFYKHQNDEEIMQQFPIKRQRLELPTQSEKQLLMQTDSICENQLDQNITEAFADFHMGPKKDFPEYKGFKDIIYFKENDCLEAIDSEEFIEFYNKIEKLTSCNPNRILKETNSRGISLLHYVCYWNKSITLRPLIGMGYQVDTLDKEMRTPLHIALSRNSQECIDIFEGLLQNPEPYADVNVEDSLKLMLSTHDDNGFTVLHRAVLNNQLKFVQSALDFCKKENLDLYRSETFGDGDTILHLAMSKGHIEMAQLIIRNDPNAIFYDNYKGMAIIDDMEAIRKLGLEEKI